MSKDQTKETIKLIKLIDSKTHAFVKGSLICRINGNVFKKDTDLAIREFVLGQDNKFEKMFFNMDNYQHEIICEFSEDTDLKEFFVEYLI